MDVGKAGPLHCLFLTAPLKLNLWKGLILRCMFILQPFPTCPDTLLVSTRLPPRPSSSHIANLPKCACLFTGLMWCPVTGRGLVGRHVPLWAPITISPTSFLSLPLCTHHWAKWLSHGRRHDPRGNAAHWQSDDASPKPSWFWAAETKKLFKWEHRWGMWLRLIVFSAQQ